MSNPVDLTAEYIKRYDGTTHWPDCWRQVEPKHHLCLLRRAELLEQQINDAHDTMDEALAQYCPDDPCPREKGVSRRIVKLLAARDKRFKKLEVARKALDTIIRLNRQTAHDKYGDSNQAESWACVKTCREALAEIGEE